MTQNRAIFIFGVIPAHLVVITILICVFAKRSARAHWIDMHRFVVVPGIIRFEEKPAECFSNVNLGGFAEYRASLGSIKAGDAEVPLSIQFSSDPDWKSPLLGTHWRAPFFDSVAVPAGKIRIKVILIDGRELELVRQRYGSAFESYDGQWRSRGFGRDFKLFDRTGAQFHYRNGQLVSFSSKSGEIDWVVTHDGAIQVNDKAGIRIASFTPTQNGDTVSVVIGDRTNVIRLLADPDKEKPQLADVKLANGKSLEFSYQTVPPLASISIVGDTVSPLKLVYEPATGFVKQVGDWSYDISAHKQNLHEALEVKRVNSETSEKETFTSDEPGIIRRQATDGTLRIVHYSLASGRQFGKVEKIEEVQGGFSNDVFRADYDPDGCIVRAWQKGKGEYLFRHDAQGRITSMEHDGKVALTREFDASGRIAAISNGIAGVLMEFSYTNDPSITVRIRRNDTPEFVMQTDKDSAFIKQINHVAGF